MQRMWRGAVTLLELSTVVLSGTTGSENIEETERQRAKERRESEAGRENRGTHRRRWQKYSETMGPGWRTRRQFLSSSGLEERQPNPRQQHRHIYCLHWIMGLADSSNPPPPQHTHTSTITIGPTVWMRGFSTVELKGNRLWGWLLPVAN